MRVIELKTWGSIYDAIKDGRKTFDVRLNDRDFQVGDVLKLLKYDPSDQDYYRNESGVERISMRVTYVLPGGQWGIQPGWAVLGLEDCETPP